ncbi:hypothetical protein CcaverHIS631_0600420 [Cutaneotrichosporon cavernicola]|nr:hypothetical protein CcaverHIS631_0600420 [Cutaneotrichosporon cavernicola]
MLSTLTSLADSDDDTEWTEGDFEVITSDCYMFRVPSYHLMSSSTIFYQHAKDSLSITFKDSTETAAIFRLALHLLTKGRLGSGESWNIENLQSLAAFLGRWQMEAALSNFVTHFQARVRNRDQSVLGLPGFLVGAYADSIEVCVETLRIPSVEWDGRNRSDGPNVLGLNPSDANGNEDEWVGFHTNERDPWREVRRSRRPSSTASLESSNLITGARGRPTFDPSSWPLATFTSGHPPAYLFALARAWGSAGKSDAARLPTEFIAFLQAAKAIGA